MGMIIQEVLVEEFEALRQDLEKKHIELGMPASGNWINELEVRTSGETSVRLLGEGYTEQLVEGREPGKFPPRAAIEEWIRVKPVVPREPDITVSQLAFLIARKIAEEGTLYYQQGGTDLIEAVITPERVQEIIDKVGFVYAAQLANEFGREFQRIKVA